MPEETTEPVTPIELPDGQLRIWEPDAAQNDLGRMYVLDVLGVSLLIRQRDDGVYVHLDNDADSDLPKGVTALLVEVNNGGEAEHSFWEAEGASTGKQLADIIRDVYGEDEPTVARFKAVEYDNGWFFTDFPEIVLANDEIDDYEGDGDGDISQQVAALSVEYGPIGAQAQMTVDLFTGHVEVDIYGGLF